MNFHSDKWIMDRVQEHYNEALEHFPEDRIVGIFLQGSQNYGLDYEGSDIDTKLIVTPTFKDIAMNRNAVSTTHVRKNEEHIDFKDIRLYMQTFRKQNLNFLEILFTKYKIVNPLYAEQWNRLVEHNEDIASYSPVRATKSMQGIAHEKYYAMEHKYPSRMAWIERFGYDPKQLHHLFRVEEYMERRFAGEPYADCLISKQADYLKSVKLGCHYLGDARYMANNSLNHIDTMCKQFLENCTNDVNKDIDMLLDDVQYNIMKTAIQKEIC